MGKGFQEIYTLISKLSKIVKYWKYKKLYCQKGGKNGQKILWSS